MNSKLDLRGVACPMNFVKTRLFLDKMAVGDTVEVLLDGGEPVESVSSSVQQEGQAVLATTPEAEGYFVVTIRKDV